ncbi:MAG: hypothetical protein ACM3PY_06155 [Omnitrophica WOR_2 bacterium]
MKDKYSALIQNEYETSRGDSLRLFQVLLEISVETGLDRALAYLEACVIEKRLAWLDRNRDQIKITGNPVKDGYSLFYESYLGLSVHRDGDILVDTSGKMVTRWWNRCPTLDACQKLGLDTRVICKKAYERPVQALLSRFHAGLQFERNYGCIRPYQPYCEEIIMLDEPGSRISTGVQDGPASTP